MVETESPKRREEIRKGEERNEMGPIVFQVHFTCFPGFCFVLFCLQAFSLLYRLTHCFDIFWDLAPFCVQCLGGGFQLRIWKGLEGEARGPLVTSAVYS